jgi:transposase
MMDRASFHRKKQLEELCVKIKVNLLFLPVYSPDYNPIDKNRANMKSTLRDNARAESFFKTLKRELETPDGKHTEGEVRLSVFMYVGAYYV